MGRISKGLDHLGESFIHKAVKIIIFGLPVKASCPPAENINETPKNASCLTMIHIGESIHDFHNVGVNIGLQR